MSETASRSGAADPWNETTLAAAQEAGVRELARLLELRGQGEDQAAIRAEYLDLLAPAPGETILDVGCGTGVVTRAVARRVAPSGRVVGLDPSPTLLAIARELAERDSLLGQIDFRVGDARALPFDDATFDAALAITALSHTTDGEQALLELLRVTRPGGRIGIFDIDPDSWIVAHPDRMLTRRIGDAASDVITDAWLGRRLPGLLEAAGAEDVRVKAFTPVERDPEGYYARLAVMRAGQALGSGAISEEERRAWLEALDAERSAGRFLAGLTHLFIWGRRPAAPTSTRPG